MPQAIVFDLFETLVTEYDPNWKADNTIAGRLGISEFLFKSEWSAMRRRRMRGEIPDYGECLRLICNNAGVPIDEELADQLRAERQAAKSAAVHHVEGFIVHMLDHLNDLGMRLAVLSNAAPEECEAWPDSRLAGRFDCAIFSCEVRMAKPDPAVYWLTCERLQVAPARAAFVGDGTSMELVGAYQAGLRPYWATWFLDRWPSWKRDAIDDLDVTRFPRIQSPGEFLEVIELTDR